MLKIKKLRIFETNGEVVENYAGPGPVEKAQRPNPDDDPEMFNLDKETGR